MNSVYIKLNSSSYQVEKKKQNIFFRIFKMALSTFIPVGNPNFDDNIDDVVHWLIEFENNEQYPNREIGLNILNQPIMIMPWRKNYGYWIDNNFLLEDFKSHFKSTNITKEEFENYWQQFLQQNGDI